MNTIQHLATEAPTVLGGYRLLKSSSCSDFVTTAHGFLLARRMLSGISQPEKYRRILANSYNRKQANSSNTTVKTSTKLPSVDHLTPSDAPPVSNAEGREDAASSSEWKERKDDVVDVRAGFSSGKDKKPAFLTDSFEYFAFLRRLKRTAEKLLSSFPLAIAELAIIGALCAVGTLIEQGQSREFYLQKYSEDWAFGLFNGEWVLNLCLDHVYTAPYFLGLLALLAASLIACTSSRQIPLVKIARRWRFVNSGASISKLDFHETLPHARLADLAVLLAGDKYQVFMRGPSLYAFKGLAGRFAPIGVHAALLLIMGGATYSAIGGYHGTIMVPQGLNFMVGEAMYPAGFLSQPPDSFDTEVHINKFTIETYPNGEVSQFRTDLSLFNLRGQEVSRKVISVNDPLRYGGFTMYQTDWGISTIQIHVDGEGPFNLVAAPLQTGDNKLFGTFLPIGDNGLAGAKGISMLARDLQSVVIYDSNGAFAGVRRSGSEKPITVDGVTVIIDDIIGSTGLEMKLDPGVPIVYAGFAALMLTTVLSYLCHLQVWALQVNDSLVVGAKSNRNRAEFAEDLGKLLNFVPEIVRDRSMENITPIISSTNEELSMQGTLAKMDNESSRS